MVESFGMQYVLQLSNTVERAQMAQQHQADEVSRAFDRELEKLALREGDQTHATRESEEVRALNDSDQRKEKRYARRLPKPREKEKEEEKKPAPEAADEGRLVDVIV